MKKTLALCLSLILILCALVVPVTATTNGITELKNSLGKYYKFTFGEDGDRFDYNSVLNKTATYKNNTYYPFWQRTDNTSLSSSLDYDVLTDSNGENSVPVLRLKTDTAVYFTPLDSNGTPFETVPGKTYVVKIDAYVETESNYSQAFIMMLGNNTPCSSWAESGSNSSRKIALAGSVGAASADGIKTFSVNDTDKVMLNRAVSMQGFTRNNGNKGVQGVIGTTTDTAYHVTKTNYFKIPTNEEAGTDSYSVYNSDNDSYEFNIPLGKYSDRSAVDADGDGITDTASFNNYLTLYLSGSSYTDEATGEKIAFTYSIASIEIWEDGYTPGVDMIVDGEVVKSVDGENRNNIPYFIPNAPEGKYFSGWYTNKSCTQLVDTSAVLPPSVTKLYAGFKEYSDNFDINVTETSAFTNAVNYPTFVVNDEKGEFLNTVDRAGWSFREFTNDGAKFYSRASWGQAGGFIACDKDGYAYVVEPNSSYTVTVQYKVDDIVTKAEVGTLPDGTTYGGGNVNILVGIGYGIKNRTDLKDSKFSFNSAEINHRDTTDWITAEYTFTTDDLLGQLPVVGVRVASAGLPCRYNANGVKINSEPADLSFGTNSITVKSISVKKNPTVVFKDKNGRVINTIFANMGEKIDFSLATESNEVIFSDGTGYTIEDITWYTDKELKTKADLLNTVIENDTEFYADVTSKEPLKAGQVSFYGFEDLEVAPEGCELAYGNSSNTALKVYENSSVSITPNVKLLKDTSYQVVFCYKSEADCKVSLSNKELVLPAAENWTRKSLVITAEGSSVLLSVLQGSAVLDSFTVNKAVMLEGVSVLNNAAEEQTGSQALRVFASYYNDLAVTERGIILCAGEQSGLSEDTPNAIVTLKSEELDICWEAKEDSIVYSNYIKELLKNDMRNVSVRAYVKTANGEKYYSEINVYSVNNTKENLRLKESKNTYLLNDNKVLEKLNVSGAYRKVNNGITFDWTANAVTLSAYCVGEAEFLLHIPAAIKDHTYTVYIDGVRQDSYYTPQVVNPQMQEFKVCVDVGNIAKVHTITLARRAEVIYGNTELQSISLNGELEKTAEKELLIEFIGDSITCGMGNLSKATDALSSDGTKTYAFLTAQKANADWRVRSRSGIGFCYSAGGTDSKAQAWDDLYGIENYFRNKSAAYENKREADIVCIYLGTNDNTAWASATGKTMSNDADNVAAEMKKMIGIVKQYNPDAKVIWINGGMTTAYAPYSKQAVAELGGAEAGYYTVDMPNGFTGGGAGHPTAAQHSEMSTILYNFLVENNLI